MLSLDVYTSVVPGAFTADAASQAGDTDSSRAPGLTSGSWTETGVLECTLQFTFIFKGIYILLAKQRRIHEKLILQF